MSHTKLVSLTQ